jgi:hypothetical protein
MDPSHLLAWGILAVIAIALAVLIFIGIRRAKARENRNHTNRIDLFKD